MKTLLNRLFRLNENRTNARTELVAGFTSFLAMAYILAVNPGILGQTGMPAGGVFVATAISSAVATLLMAFCANYPFALAPAMGLNAYFTYTVVFTLGYSWPFALMAVFVEGLIFLALSVTPVREKIFDAIPMPLKAAVSVGIGLFICFIGLQGAHVIVDNPAVLVGLQGFSAGSFHTHGICAVLALVGFIITAALAQRNFKAAILLGILVTWALGIGCELLGVYVPDPAAKCFSLIPQFDCSTIGNSFREFGTLIGSCFDTAQWTCKSAEGVSGWTLFFSPHFLVVIFAFLFVDLFDTLGTLTGVAAQADMLDKDGKLPRIRGALLADSIGTSVGAVLGTSTVSSYVESAAGVTAGGRTGLTALTTAVLFLAALVLAPVFLAIPAFATAPALIMVGFYMMKAIGRIDFERIEEAVPAYIAIFTMPFAYSISDGICLGIISWTVLNTVVGKWRNVTVLMWVLTALFITKYTLL